MFPLQCWLFPTFTSTQRESQNTYPYSVNTYIPNGQSGEIPMISKLDDATAGGVGGEDVGGNVVHGAIPARSSSPHYYSTLPPPPKTQVVPHYQPHQDHQPNSYNFTSLDHSSIIPSAEVQHSDIDSTWLVDRMEESADHAHNIEAQQEAAKEYHPVLEGPAVTPKISSVEIAVEYAKADPIYVEKTKNLPQSYSHYRAIKGDGNCGWRAIGFSYFEKLAECRDQEIIEGEVARLMSMNQMLGNIGGYTYYEDWADEAFGLLRELATMANDVVSAVDLVTDRWNDVAVSSALIYYLRLLAATYLKANASTFDPFVPDNGSIQEYCSTNIEPVDREIDQLGIMALVSVLYKPLNFVLEIAYLDLSPGSRANVYRFPQEAEGQDISSIGAIIDLLYRPGHYDILYRGSSTLETSSAAVSSSELNIQINRMTSIYPLDQFTETFDSLRTFSTNTLSLASIPGLLPPPTESSLLSFPVHHPEVNPAAYTPCSDTTTSWINLFGISVPALLPVSEVNATTPTASSQLVPIKTEQTISDFPRALEIDNTCGIPADSFQSSLPTASTLVSESSECNIRFSTAQLNYDENKMTIPEPPSDQLTTAAFKNSIFNRAHFGNPGFHPEEWSPRGGSTRSRHTPRKKQTKDSH